MSNSIFGFDFEQQWDYENGFYLTSHITRIPKMLAHYELYKSIAQLPGHIVECGVFKGASFIRWCTFREVIESPYSRKIIGFDAFGEFPQPSGSEDREFVKRFEEASGHGIAAADLSAFLSRKGIGNFELVEGDIGHTLEDYIRSHPELRIALLHIDVDVYEPTAHILEQLYDRVVSGGLVVFDDYGTVEGETRAVDEFLAERQRDIRKLSISHIPSYIRKR